MEGSIQVKEAIKFCHLATLLKSVHPSLLRGDERLEAGDGLLLDLLLHLRHHLLQCLDDVSGFSHTCTG